MALFLKLLISIWLAALGCWWLWQRSRKKADLGRIKARLAGTATKKAVGNKPALLDTGEAGKGRFVLNLLVRLQLMERMRLLIEQAGLKWSVARMMHGALALFLTGFTSVWYIVPEYRVGALPVGLVLGVMPLIFVVKKRQSRLKSFEEQFPESLEFLGRSMRAGHAFTVSLEMIHTEFKEPLAGEFRRAFDEQNLGMPLDVALQKLAQRVPLIDVSFFVSAVLLQKRTGGNLAELLDKLAYLIRERFKLRGRIRAISAHGRMTGTVLSLIPVAVGGIMCYVNPDYGKFFVNDETGQLMMGAAVALQLIGYGVIKKIVSIEV